MAAYGVELGTGHFAVSGQAAELVVKQGVSLACALFLFGAMTLVLYRLVDDLGEGHPWRKAAVKLAIALFLLVLLGWSSNYWMELFTWLQQAR